RFSGSRWQGHAMRNAAAARCRSSSRVALKFCGHQTCFEAGEINHEEWEGHEEFAVAASLREARRRGKNGAHCRAQCAATTFAWVVSGIFFVMRRICWQWLIFAVLAASGCGQKPAPVVDLASERQRMVREQLMPRGVHDKRVLAGISKVPREEFVPQDSRAASYTDQPLSIGYGQTISQPYIVAFMTGQLAPPGGDRSSAM